MKDASNGNDGQKNEDEGNQLIFMTPFGIKEEDFMRTVASGKYSCTVQEIEQLLIDGKITLNEARVLYFIKSKTINFRNTHTRMKRKDIEAALNLTQARVCHAIRSLVSQNYLLEKVDNDNYSFYALDPRTFGGVIVLRSKNEVAHRINRAEKLQKRLISKGNTKSISPQYQKGIDWISKRYSEEVSIVRNYSGFGVLKYILLKYILLNSISAGRAESVLRTFEDVNNPEWMIQNFAKLIQKQPGNAMGIVEELLRAHREQTDSNGRKIQTNAVAYLISNWDLAKQWYQHIVFHPDMSPETVELRAEACSVICEYPIQNNIVPLKKTGA